VKLFLLPFSWLFGFVVYLRNQFYDLGFLKSTEFDVPVISIGNITVGGTGKTPHVEYLITQLKDKFNVVTLSRGYKRKTKGFRLAKIDSTVAEVGDEPLQIKKKFPEITVSVCENRVTGVENLLYSVNEKTPDVILLDDAFQHRRIKPGINILLIDYNRQIKEDTLLPAGRLREGVAQTRRADIIIFTKCPAEVTPIMLRILQKDVQLKPYQKLYFTTFDYGKIKPGFSAVNINESFYSEKKHSILIVSGVASPALIQNHLEKFSKNVEILSYPDHHNYTIDDIHSIMRNFNQLKGEKKLIVTTEKDLMRFNEIKNLPGELENVLFYLPIKVQFLNGEEKMFNKKIINYVGENKSNRELHKRKNKLQS
jgi:tetraacyldisaccharide 4'-kinase